MSRVRRLRHDEVVTPFPELGPTVPDGGYSWVVLSGILLVQMTVPSVLTMYGIVLGYLCQNSSVKEYFDPWEQKIILTPVLYIAFWSLADPWTKTVVNMASVPRLVGIIGVVLLSLGVIASGYLATGGVGAYFASISAGAVMGIGASLVMLQSDHVLRKHFRRKLLLALMLKNIGASIGLIFIPCLTYLLLTGSGLKLGLLLMTIAFLPTAVGTLTLRSPATQRASPYRLLLSVEEDNELPIRITPDMAKETANQEGCDGLVNTAFREDEDRERAIFSGDDNNIYAYQEQEEDVDLFVSPIAQTSNKWREQLQVFKSFKFWITLIGWIGMKMSGLLFWILLPTSSYLTYSAKYDFGWVLVSVIAGFGTLLPSIASYKVLNIKSQYRRIYFGLASAVGCIVLIGFNYTTEHRILVMCAALGGISLGAISSCQDLALYDIFGMEIARHSYRAFHTLTGLIILLPCFVHDANFYLNLAAALQFIGAVYWISVPIIDIVKAGKSVNHATSSTNREQT